MGAGGKGEIYVPVAFWDKEYRGRHGHCICNWSESVNTHFMSYSIIFIITFESCSFTLDCEEMCATCRYNVYISIKIIIYIDSTVTLHAERITRQFN